MKKFTNLPLKKEKRETSLFKKLKKSITETLNIKFKTDNDKYLIEDYHVNLDDVSNILEDYINKHMEESEKMMRESMVYQYHNNLDIASVNQKMEFLKENLEKLDTVPSPEDVFNSEDYINIDDGAIELESLNEVPDDYFIDNLSMYDIDNFFSAGNRVIIKNIGEKNGWQIEFTPNQTEYPVYEDFIYKNKNFIADFIRSSQMLVGAKNLVIDSKLLNLI